MLAQLLKTFLSVREVWGLIPGPVKLDTVSPTACLRCDVSLDLCCPGAEPRGWSRHSLHASANYREYNEDILCSKSILEFRLIATVYACFTNSRATLRAQYRVFTKNAIEATPVVSPVLIFTYIKFF